MPVGIHVACGCFQPPPTSYPLIDTRDIAARNIGAFFSGMTANDGFVFTQTEESRQMVDELSLKSPEAVSSSEATRLPQRKVGGTLAGCCVVNGSRGLYYVWHNIVTGNEHEVRVNLLLNRSSPWLDVRSHLPGEGKVVIDIKKARELGVRIPGYLDLQSVVASIGQRRLASRPEGRYLLFEGLAAGEQLTLTFPLEERTVARVIGRWPYMLHMRGANVIEIDPRGSVYPLYARTDDGQPVTRDRFASRVTLSL